MTNKRKHSLVFDGNFFLFKTLFVLPRNKKQNLMDTDDERGMFLRKLSQDFAAEIRKFSSIISRVVFVIDSSSWRKDFYPEANYKGHRVSDETVNWENVWDAFGEFISILKTKRVIVHKVPGAEGDDLIFAWSTFLNLKGENVIINSGDRDLTQLIGRNLATDSYTIFYTNTQKVLIGYKGFVKWLESSNKKTVTDVFDMKRTVTGKDVVKDTFKALINKNNLKVSEVSGDHVVLHKVLAGDKGDNVLPAYYYMKVDRKGKSRMFGLSDKKVELIVNNFESKHGKFKRIYLFEPTYRNDIVKIIKEKLKADKMSHEEILNNIENNINLVMLHPSVIPEPIQEQMFKNTEMMYNLDPVDLREISNKEKILEGTGYLQDDYVPGNYSFFKKDDSDTSDMSFIKKDNDVKDENMKNLKGLF